MTFNTVNPFDNSILKSYEYHSFCEAEAKVEEHSKLQKKWQDFSVEHRAKVVKKIAKKLRESSAEASKLMTLEMGKPITQSLAEIEKCAIALETLADLAINEFQSKEISAHYKRTNLIAKPYGLVLSIQPWNFPFWQVLRMAACAWMGGNLVVLKHSDLVSGTAEMIEQLSVIDGLKLCLNLRLAHADVAKLITSDFINMLTLTGSSKAGKAVGAIAGANLKKQILELGGADAYIVLPDCDLELAVKNCVASRLINSGQSCISAKRFFLHESIFENFKKQFIELMKTYKMGDPLLSETMVGPLAASHFVNNLSEQIQLAKTLGASYVVAQSPSEIKGNFVELGVLDFAENLSAFAVQEVFAPIACIYKFKNLNDVVEVVNRGPFALGAAIFTSNSRIAEEVQRKIQVGTLAWNTFVQSDARVPFGGVKESGVGCELGLQGLNEFVYWQVFGQS